MDIEMSRLHRMFHFSMVIHGAARGADTLADEWAARKGIDRLACPADWNGPLKKGAGFARNQSMLEDHKPDIVVAFAGGNGTADMVRRALSANVPVFMENWGH